MHKNYRKTLRACYLGFITQAIAANFTPLLFLTFHADYGIPLGQLALISTTFFLTPLVVDVLCARIPSWESWAASSSMPSAAA